MVPAHSLSTWTMRWEGPWTRSLGMKKILTSESNETAAKALYSLGAGIPH